ncbi:MAG: two-component regulator propeller domain-containing protein [Bryobacteraceae bacterium]|jgi:ligand-binding sensor domain-containing protein/signal transduction histidine kinase
MERSVVVTGRAPRKGLALWAAAAAIFFAGSCYAIDPHRAMSQYVQERWGAEQGLPRGPIYAITQTVDGYLWIATDAGLIRFDGLHFRLIQDSARPSESRSALGLAADKDGSLWIRLRNLTLRRYRDGKFDDPFRPGAVSNITAMGRTNQGTLLAARMQLGAFTYRDGGLEAVARAEGVPRSPVITVAQQENGTVWLGTRGAGLFKLQGGKTQRVTEGLPDPKVNCILPDGNGSLWIGTDAGIAHWNGTEFTTAETPAALRKYQILGLIKDRDGNLWIGTDSGGLLRLNADGIASLDLDQGQQGHAITALFEDREGNLWIGSSNGMSRLRDSPFVTYSAAEGLPTEGSNPVYVDSDNRLWFPRVSGGLWWFKDGKSGTVRAGGLDKDIVYSIAGSKNELWLGRQRGGLTRLRSENGSYAATTYTKRDGLAQDSIFSVYETRAGVVWSGSLSGGVSKLDHGAFTTYTMADGLASNTVASMLEGSGGTMWFATPSGLSSLSKGSWRTFRIKDGLPSQDINCLAEDSNGVLWAGTSAGLAFRRAGRFAILAKAPDALKEQILGLAADKYGGLWVSTSNHVLRVNRERVLDGTLANDDVREYGLADGLRGMEGVKRQQSVFTDSLGRVWFSVNQGISVVDPARVTGSSAPAIADIQTISADGEPVELKNPIRIGPGHHRIVFGYAGLILSVPERVRYRYWLEGYDREWSEPVAEREAGYTNLGPRSYRFHVMASNPDGVWTKKEAAVSFEVDPAYWQTWWFQAGLVFLCVLAGVAVYRLRLRQLAARLNIRFEERLAERSRIAQELHDTLLQGFISASMQVHVAADRLPADSPIKTSLTRSLELMRQVIDEGRNAVRGLRSQPSGSLDLEDAFSQILDELTRGEQAGEAMAFRIISEGSRRSLHPVLRDEVYRIGREALVNAFRHAKAKSIEIELDYSPNSLRVLIRDDGCGIDGETLRGGREGHWGLSGMRERADRIGARLRLWSGAGAGTEVELWVPGHIAFKDQAAPGLFHREHFRPREKVK